MKRSQALLLRDAVQQFVRASGLLSANETPCGQPLPVSEAHALMSLLAASEPLTLQELGSELSIDKSNVSRLCKRLRSSGLVSTRPCKSDGRAKRLALTAKGERVASTVERASRERFANIVAALPRSRAPGIVEAISELTQAIHRASEPSGVSS